MAVEKEHSRIIKSTWLLRQVNPEQASDYIAAAEHSLTPVMCVDGTEHFLHIISLHLHSKSLKDINALLLTL